MRSGRCPVPGDARTLPTTQTTEASYSRAELKHPPATQTTDASDS